MGKKFIDRNEKKDVELPQKKRISDDGVIGMVIEVVVRNYKIENQGYYKGRGMYRLRPEMLECIY